MRDLLTKLETLNEAAVGLSPGEIIKYEDRYKKFIAKIAARSPFTTIDGEEVIIDPREAARFSQLYDSGAFKGGLKARIFGSDDDIALSKLAKTGEFGGAAVAAGGDQSSAGKEGLVVKPSQIGICDQDIPASDFYEMLASNKTLASTEYGQVIIKLAEYIMAGEFVMLPEEYRGKEKEKVRKAIVDYAGEYLGVLALLYNRSRFPRRANFEKWLGGSLGELMLNFPSKANTNLADSFATITNPGNSHSLNISSKGTGGGAAPAISGLKIPDELSRNPKFKAAIEFINICKDSDKSAGPSTVTSAFRAMDLIYETNPNAIPKKWHKFLPFASKSPKLMNMALESLNAFKPPQKKHLPLPNKYQELFSDLKSTGAASDGGKLIYTIKKVVADAINNNDGIPNFQDTILQVLEMNFIQQYCDYSGGELKFATQWPAKLDGNISVENKSSSGDPTAGGFSFKLGRTDDDVSSEPGEERVDDEDEEPFIDLSTAAQDITNPRMSRSKKEEPTNLGRDKRAKF